MAVFFDRHAEIDVGGLLASSLRLSYTNYNDLRNKVIDFVTHRAPLQFRDTDPFPGIVSNYGEIRAADGGYIALLGEAVMHYGVSTVDRGSIVLAAGSGYYLSLGPDGLLSLVPDPDAPQREGMILGIGQHRENDRIEANGGLVRMHHMADDWPLLLNGVVRATSIGEREGRIVIHADNHEISIFSMSRQTSEYQADVIELRAKDDVTIHSDNVLIDAGRLDIATPANVTFDESPIVQAGEINVSAGGAVDVRDQARIEAGAFHVTSGKSVSMNTTESVWVGTIGVNTPLKITAPKIYLGSELLYKSAHDGQSVELDAHTLTIDTQLTVPGDDTAITIRNSTASPTILTLTPSGHIGAQRIGIEGKNGGTIQLEGSIFTGELDLRFGGQIDKLNIANLTGTGTLHPTLRIFGADGQGTWLEVGSANIYTNYHLTVSGKLRAAGNVQIVTKPTWNLTLEDEDPTVPTQIDADGQIVLAGGRFRNHTNYESELFPGAGRVLIFSSTDRFGYNPGNLGFAEEYGIEFDPTALPARAQNTIFIDEASPAPVFEIDLGRYDLSKVFDNTEIDLDLANYLDSDDLDERIDTEGLTLRLDSKEGRNGLDVGKYVLVPYGAASDDYRLKFIPGKVTITPRPLINCGDDGCPPIAVERWYGDHNQDFASLLAPYLNLAPGHTFGDTGGFSSTTAGTMSPIGDYPILLWPDADNPKSRNYIFPEESNIGFLTITPRPVYVEFVPYTIKEGQRVPSAIEFRNRTRIHNLPYFESIERLRWYMFPYYPSPVDGPGTYRVDFELDGDDDFLANYIVLPYEDENSGLFVIEPNLEYYIHESWKRRQIEQWEEEQRNKPSTPAVPPIQAPQIAGFSSSAWPVVGKAMGAYLSENAHLSEKEFMALLDRLAAGDTETMGMLLPYLFAEFNSLLFHEDGTPVDPSTLSYEETSFLEDVARYIQRHRYAAAADAWLQAERWRKDHFEKTTQGGRNLAVMVYTTPKPPKEFLERAQSGFFVTDQMYERWDGTITALATTAAAGAGAGLGTLALAGVGALKGVASVVFPFAGAAVAAKSVAAGGGTSLGVIGSSGFITSGAVFAGPAALVVATLVTIGYALEGIISSDNFDEEMKRIVNEATRVPSISEMQQMMQDSPELMFTYFSLQSTGVKPPNLPSPSELFGDDEVGEPPLVITDTYTFIPDEEWLENLR